MVGSVKQFDNLITDMESALGDAEYLAGDAYSLADAAMTPYVNRLSDLGLLQLWAESAPRVLGWFDAIKARGSFTQGVTEYLTEKDKTAFDAIDPTTPQRVAHILDGT
ncbi:MAG: glutathione S-transferase C-terminal domain-containing protein [Rhodospirillaceae bacterium]|nr:glutathione S-transferase C-terminal domain-containing protein [Rhodospirillaceae bacterium]